MSKLSKRLNSILAPLLGSRSGGLSKAALSTKATTTPSGAAEFAKIELLTRANSAEVPGPSRPDASAARHPIRSRNSRARERPGKTVREYKSVHSPFH